jgi:hypothetical protein
MAYNSQAGDYAVTYGTALERSLYMSVSGQVILIQVTDYGVLGGEEVKSGMLKCPECAYLSINTL